MSVEKHSVFCGAGIVTLFDGGHPASGVRVGAGINAGSGAAATVALGRLPDAVEVLNGRIVSVGQRKDVLARAGSGCKIIDCGEGIIHPGFIDSHSHLSSYALCLAQTDCGLERGSIFGVLEALRASVRDSDQWVLGYGYDDTGIAEKRHLTRHDLDLVSRDRPVFVSHISVHLGYANTRALELMGFTPDTEIAGGALDREDTGSLSGVLYENAAFAAFARLPRLSEAQLRQNMLKAVALYNAVGFTTVQDGGVGFNGDPTVIINTYMDLMREDELNAHIYLQMTPPVMDSFERLGLWDFASERVTLGGVKFFVDGSIQNFTAALNEGYHSRPDKRGELTCAEDEIEALISKYDARGMQVAVHANGDYAVEVVLRGFEKAAAARDAVHAANTGGLGSLGNFAKPDQAGRSGRVGRAGRTGKSPHMLIHAQTVSDSQLARMQACGLMPTFFPRHIEVWGDRHHEIFLGPQRAARLNPAGSCVRMQMPFALHADTPVLPPTALDSMHAAVNRRTSGGRVLGADQCITPAEALRAYTVHAALCCGGAADRGCIEPGRRADFTILSENLERVDSASVNKVKVLMTVCNGRVVHGCGATTA